MKTMGRLSVVLTLVLIAVGQTSTARAKEVFRLNQQIAIGSFSGTDPSGCIFSQVSVTAVEASVHFPPSPVDSSSSGFVSISQFDSCSGNQVQATGIAFLGDEDFQVSSTLDSATLNATINVYDYISDTSFDVSINLTWTSTGPIGRRNFHSHESLPDSTTNNHSNSAFRPAQASGTISAGEMNFTPTGVSDYAELSSDKTGEVSL